MNKYRLAGVAVTVIVASPMSAYAVNFDFSFTGTRNGVVSGEIFGLAASGPSAAQDIKIYSVPADLEPPSGTFDLFAQPGFHTYVNSFSVNQGVIVKASFSAPFQSSHGGHTLGLNVFGAINKYFGANLTYNQSGIGAIAFTPAASVAAVPEPASIALLGAGLAGISAFRRRRIT